jgi:hypothetical protein
MGERNNPIREIIIKFCEMMLDKEEEVQYVKVHIGMKDKTRISFNKFREYVK